MRALKKAMSVYSDAAGWEALMIRAMSQDWSWRKSARKYMELYLNM